MVKVCVATTSFPRWLGDGQGAFIWESVQAVAAAGAQVRVIAAHAPGLPVHDEMQGIPVWRPRYWRPERFEILKQDGGGLPIAWQRSPLARLLMVPFGLVHALSIARWAGECDLVHAHWTLSAAAAVLMRPQHKRPVLVTLQGSDIFRVAGSPLGAHFTRGVLTRCNAITVLSRALAASTEATGIASDKLQIIPNGVDTRMFTPLPAERREDLILCVGSLIPRKGIEFLLAAAPSVLAACPSYRLVLIGDGPQAEALKQIALRLGVAERVSFLDFLPQDQVRSWMQRARLLVLPSVEEGLGVVLLEALACGTPIVASDVGGIPDVVTPDVGTLVAPRDPVALAGAIIAILSDAHRWSAQSRAARERAVVHFDWHQIAEQIMKVYRTLIT